MISFQTFEMSVKIYQRCIHLNSVVYLGKEFVKCSLSSDSVKQELKLTVSNTQHFNFQLMHTTLKNVELLKHFKIRKTAPACFGLQGNHHQGATVST